MNSITIIRGYLYLQFLRIHVINVIAELGIVSDKTSSRKRNVRLVIEKNICMHYQYKFLVRLQMYVQCKSTLIRESCQIQ